MDFLKQWMHVLFCAILGCTNNFLNVNGYLSHNTVFTATPVPPYHNNVYVQQSVGPPMSTLNPVLPTVTPIMPAAAPAGVYRRQFFSMVTNRRPAISIRPVNIQNAIRTPQSNLYQLFTRLNPNSQSKIYNVLRNHMGSSRNTPTFQVPQSSHSSLTMNINDIAAMKQQSQAFEVMPKTRDLISRELEQNSQLLDRLVGQNQMGSSTASRLEQQIRDMKQELAAIEPAEGQQQEQLIKQLGDQFQQQISLFEEQDPNPAVSIDKINTGAAEPNSLADIPHSSPPQAIDEMFATMAAESGKSISFSSDIGPGTYKVEYDMLITQEDMEQKYSPRQEDERVKRDSPTDDTAESKGVSPTDDTAESKGVSPTDDTAESKGASPAGKTAAVAPEEGQKTRVKRALVKNVNVQWSGGRIPYILRSRDFSSRERRDIHLSLREWESYTCVRFVPASSKDQYSLEIKDSDGCHSYVGMKRKNQMVGLAKPCRKKSIILHEIGHAIGMFHEQARPDRNSYINVLYNHILPPVRFNFQKIDPEQTTNYSIPYDYLSIMHYGETAFSFNRSAITMKAKDPRFQKKMGKAKRISFRDVMSVNAMYNCSGHCSVIPNCPFKEAFVGKDCRCWCPTEENDREPAMLCPTPPKVTPPRQATPRTSTRTEFSPNQSKRESNGVLLKIAFNPNRRQTSDPGASAVLTPVGRGHNFIRNPSDRGARMLPTRGSEGSQSLAATLSNLPPSIRIGSMGSNGERASRRRGRNPKSRGLGLGRRNKFRRLPNSRSQRPQRPSTTPSGSRLEQQLAKELSRLNGINTGTISRPNRPSPLLSGLMPTRQQSGSEFDTLVNDVLGLLSGGRRVSSGRNSNGAVVSSQTSSGGVATADLKQLLQEFSRLNSQSQMSPLMPVVGHVRHSHVGSRSRNADILSQRRTRSLLRQLSDRLLSASGRQSLTEEQMLYILQSLPPSSYQSVTHTHPVVIDPTTGQEHHHHHHHVHHGHRHSDILSPITDHAHFHPSP